VQSVTYVCLSSVFRFENGERFARMTPSVAGTRYQYRTYWYNRLDTQAKEILDHDGECVHNWVTLHRGRWRVACGVYRTGSVWGALFLITSSSCPHGMVHQLQQRTRHGGKFVTLFLVCLGASSLFQDVTRLKEIQMLSSVNGPENWINTAIKKDLLVEEIPENGENSNSTSSKSNMAIKKGNSVEEIPENGENSNSASNNKGDATTSMTQNASQARYFILHVGPMKTGTTSIQCTLRHLEETGMLHQHNFKLLETENCRPSRKVLKGHRDNGIQITGGGKTTYDNVVAGQAWLPGCWMQWNKDNGTMPSCWKESYQQYIQNHHQKHSIILSNENLMKFLSKTRDDASLFLDHLVRSLQETGGYRFVVLATYRRFFDWAISVHHEGNNVMQSARPAHAKWPGAGGVLIPSFIETISGTLDTLYSNRWVERAASFFSSHENVTLRIANIHQGDLEHNIFCNGFPNTTSLHKAMCSSDKISTGKVRHNQAVHYLWYDAVAVEAYQRGLLLEQKSRRDIIHAIEEFQEKQLNRSRTDFPMECPTEDLYKKLLEESLRRERFLLPYLLDHDEQTSQEESLGALHRAAFEKAKLAHTFCTVNATAVLEDVKWIDFFKHMPI
jgi:hypothetical protein